MKPVEKEPAFSCIIHNPRGSCKADATVINIVPDEERLVQRCERLTGTD